MPVTNIQRDRRRWVLVRLGHLFAEIDEAFARRDFRAAQAMAPEVAQLLKETDERGPSDDTIRATGIRIRGG